MSEKDITIIDKTDSVNQIAFGPHFDRIKENISDKEGQQKLEDETLNIVQRLNFNGEAGLIVGRIQSGKTLSFEAVTGLSRDNDVPLIIISILFITIINIYFFNSKNF